MNIPEGRLTLEQWNLTQRYAVVTTVQSFRHRYVVPLDKLVDEDGKVDAKWAMDCVTMEEVKEFSQEHLGEQIVDMDEYNKTEILQLFDRDNEYLSGWTEEKKIEWIRDCWEKQTK